MKQTPQFIKAKAYFLQRVLVFFHWLPAVFALLILVTGNELVMRDDATKPIIGMPRSLYLPTFLISSIYAALWQYGNKVVSQGVVKENPSEHWIGVFFFGLFAVPGLVLFLNRGLDNSVATTHQTQVLGKKIHRDKYTTRYAIVLADWKYKGKSLLLYVNRKFYEGVKITDQVSITTKKGYFGYERLRDYKKQADVTRPAL